MCQMLIFCARLGCDSDSGRIHRAHARQLRGAQADERRLALPQRRPRLQHGAGQGLDFAVGA